ncbi:cobyrinate a,c-diamide synthase [Vulcanococcus limneticus]|uniref:cobyrinate a,c-diamide synthase n=1 Tax=Vulcanococcus limneticus TaxID=2170428 RepID=UPI00398BE7D9
MACVLTAPSSGSGKTLVSLALTALARRRGASIQTFKVGPDYLDPQLLSAVSGRPCRNLDPLLCGEAWVARSFQGFGSRAELALVEGVMGLFDGRGPSSAGSTAAVAGQLGLPLVLVVEASRQAGSVAALVRGFRDHDPRLQLAGVVLNGVGSERHRALLAEALEAIAMPLLGALPRHDSLHLPSRHLGLLPAHELADLEQRQGAWADLAERHLDLERLWPLLSAPAAAADGLDPIHWCLAQERGADGGTPEAPGASGDPGSAPLPVAIASDAAFHFRYPEASELLRARGMEVVPWSPLADEPLPARCHALILPGGYPELQAGQLAQSRRSLTELRAAAAAGLPIYAECGGLLLLGGELCDPGGTPHAMAGVLPFRARRGPLSLGYRDASVRDDGLVLRRGEQVCGHEFHRWQLEPLGAGDGGGAEASGGPEEPIWGEAAANLEPLWQLEGWGSPSRREGWSSRTLHASWLHLHWTGCSAISRRLRDAAARHASANGTGWSAANPAPATPSSVGG